MPQVLSQERLEVKLADLPLGAIRFLDRVTSTNDEAATWITTGAPDLALVVADEQTQGRGRSGRVWYTPPSAALAFSLVLYLQHMDAYILPRLTALGAVAVREALHQVYGLPAQIKWPNDVLVHRRKIAGILAEAQWSGEQMSALILGVGINIAAESIGSARRSEAELRFPATYLEEVLERPVYRLEVLHAVLAALLHWRPRLSSPAFLQIWEASLAFRGEMVQIISGQTGGKDGLPRVLERPSAPSEQGKIMGLAPDGSLKLRTADGTVKTVRFGEVRLRPVTHIPGEP